MNVFPQLFAFYLYTSPPYLQADVPTSVASLKSHIFLAMQVVQDSLVLCSPVKRWREQQLSDHFKPDEV